MEALGGGGHLSNAATQIKNTTVEKAIESLIEVVESDEKWKNNESYFHTRC